MYGARGGWFRVVRWTDPRQGRFKQAASPLSSIEHPGFPEITHDQPVWYALTGHMPPWLKPNPL